MSSDGLTMSKMRENAVSLPQLGSQTFLTDGGIETTLIYRQGFELPLFAAFVLLKDKAGTEALRAYFRSYATIARQHGVGIILESATWRANPDWAMKLGYSATQLVEANRQAIDLLKEIWKEFQTEKTPVVISGCVGPRDDGYNPKAWMAPEEAERYHRGQITTFQRAGADMVCALTMTYPEEAIGITKVAQAAGLPLAISFTVETDGKLPNRQSLKEAIGRMDQATGQGPAYYMINCAHPAHFEGTLVDEPWARRIRGVRANASRKSHAELNEATALDSGDPQQLAQDYRRLRERLHGLTILGGCCGTDERHISLIADACVLSRARSKSTTPLE